MRLGIISTMSSASEAWGGSEELWFATAIAALHRGDAVAICLPKAILKREKLDRLRQAGASVFSYNSTRLTRAANLLARCNRALSLLFTPSTKNSRPLRAAVGATRRLIHLIRTTSAVTSQLQKWRPDFILVNEASSIPIPEIVDDIASLSSDSAYAVLCHNNHGLALDAEARQSVGKYFSNASMRFFVAEATRRMTERQLVRELPGKIVRNPVNISDTTQLGWPSPAELTMLCIGQLRTEWKGQDLLLEALGNDVWRMRKWYLEIVGSGRDREYLRELIAFYGLTNHVSLRAHTSDIRSLWSGAQLLVLPSRVESAPLVVVEAMLLGRPVVATDVGGIVEWIEDGKNGFVAAAPSVEALRVALDKAWNQRDRLQDMGVEARKSVLQRYDPKAGQTLLGEIDAIIAEAS